VSGAGDPADLDTLAGEYVLGVLDDSEMRVVRAQARDNPALAGAIVAWQRRLAPLAEVVGEQTPPPALWARIEAAVAPLPQLPANDIGPLPVRPASLRSWRIATALSLALAAALAVFAVLPRPSPLAGEIATIAPLGAPAAAFLARVQPDGSVILSAFAPKPVPADRDLELWILPVGATKVAALGVLPSTGRTLRLAGLPATGTQLLVSLEPKGGSPTGQPTGPVLYGGTLTAL
jgi:anti-sigma-K factor RskA